MCHYLLVGYKGQYCAQSICINIQYPLLAAISHKQISTYEHNRYPLHATKVILELIINTFTLVLVKMITTVTDSSMAALNLATVLIKKQFIHKGFNP